MNPYSQTLEKQRSIHCFVLDGEDTFGRERARGQIVEAIEAICGSPLTRVNFDPAVEPFAHFIQKALSPSLFADLRLFHVPHAQTLSAVDIEELNAVLSGVIPDVYIVIEIDDESKKASEVVKKLSVKKRCASSPPTCLHEKFDQPREYEIAKWLVANTSRLINRRISLPDAEYLADRVGYDLNTLHSELQKIDLHLEPNAPINRAAIDTCTGALREIDQFELAAAVGRRDFPAALRAIDALFSVKTYLPLMVSALTRHFWSLLRIKKFLGANPEIAGKWAASRNQRGPNSAQTETGMAIGMAAGLLREGQQGRIYPVLIKSGVIEQSAGFSDRELSQIIRWLLDFDTGFKTGRFPPTMQSMQLLCYKIIRIRNLTKDGALA